MIVRQMELISAILVELERQAQGVTANQAQMNTIIAAADQIVAAMRNSHQAQIITALAHYEETL